MSQESNLSSSEELIKEFTQIFSAVAAIYYVSTNVPAGVGGVLLEGLALYAGINVSVVLIMLVLSRTGVINYDSENTGEAAETESESEPESSDEESVE